MIVLRIGQGDWELVSHKDPAGRESAGIALASVSPVGGRTVLTVRSVFLPSSDEYSDRTEVSVELSPSFVAKVVAQAKQQQASVVFFHTHPGEGVPRFSATDDRGEAHLREFLGRRVPGVPHLSLVTTVDGCAVRAIDGPEECQVDVVGATLRRVTVDAGVSLVNSERATFDRQIRAFGEQGQGVLRRMKVAVVGLGGTGSHVVQQLSHLGVGELLLIDPDAADATSLNRLVGIEQADVGRTAKVEVARRLVSRIGSGTKASVLAEDVTEQRVAKELIAVDAVFCCTDSHGSRYVLNQLAYQFLLPVFDMGVVIVAEAGRVSHVFGRTQMLAPGLPCLTCLRTLDPEQVRRDLLSDFERRQDPYVTGDQVFQPAVISLNGGVASLAVTMFLQAAIGLPGGTRYQMYDAIRGQVRRVDSSPKAACVTCSTSGAFARGLTWPLPGKA